MNAITADEQARTRALDGRRSFIVHAPAGSGKTELLIQRYLTLLATVEQPEQVVAITFTRKAAAEMRRRVLQALRDAGSVDRAPAGHREATIEIARAVLTRDRELCWSLLLQPQRMRIDTLDALNAWLALQLPILSGGVADAEITEDAALLYAHAARRTVARIAEPGAVGAALRSLHELVGNAVERLEVLLAGLLPKRDQWLRHLARDDAALLRERLTAGLTALHEDRVQEVRALVGETRAARLFELAASAAPHASRPRTRALLTVFDRDAPPPSRGAAALPAWQGIAHLLLTNGGQWRRSFTKNEGFGPERGPDKEAIARLRDALQSNAVLRESLESLQYLPEAAYPEDQWLDLLAVRVVLLQLVAELRVLFAERRTVDFVELAMAAEQALGGVEEPSDLLLAMDRRIQHVLVDEFQDTSHAQFRLLELLTAGWTPGDGRSLFLVGDPMQSIYRFRDADMSLFLKAKRHGVGGIALEPLVLERNFRSAPVVAGWINAAFAGIFPDRDREDLGVARFHACVAVRGAVDSQSVTVHPLAAESEAAETRQVVAILEQERARSKDQSIAILVQSRSHLRGLHAQLKARGLTARAVEIESLAETQAVQDLIGLTRALAHLADRIAWLAILRAPWCGIGWQDLHALCADRPAATIWELLHDAERVAALSADGRERAAAMRALLEHACRVRPRMSFARWVEYTWRALDGPSALHGADDHDRMRQYFEDLSRLAAAGDLDDPAMLESFFLQPRRQPDPADAPGIEIMTIHRAKGLEFDTVILLGLGRRVRGPEPAALYWQERIRVDGAPALLLAPMTRTVTGLTDYLQRVEQQRDEAERARLLYVATTRARERLHLVARLGLDKDTPPSGTLLALLWPRIASEFRRVEPALPAAERPALGEALPLVRFVGKLGARSLPPVEPHADTPGSSRPEYEWAGLAAVHVGTIVHACLERMADADLDGWHASAIAARLPRLRRELAMLGVAPRDLDAALEQVQNALTRVVADPRARWVLARHPEARSELRLTVVTDLGLEHLRLDRTFIDAEGVRWIIDYKTSRHEGGDPDAFMDAEVERYRAQLERYAAAMARIDARPIRVALYFPLLAGFRDWTPAVPQG